jgi:NhaP-type Na+/H+ or K+/H+ antiporter
LGARQVRKEIEETLHHFWEMASYVANTIIFILAGVIIGRMFVETSDNFTAVDAVSWWRLHAQAPQTDRLALRG